MLTTDQAACFPSLLTVIYLFLSWMEGSVLNVLGLIQKAGSEISSFSLGGVMDWNPRSAS